jgi:hypothetical protein
MPKFNQRRHFEHDSLDFPQTNDRNKTNLVMGGHSKIHFQERLSETESFKSSIQAVEQPARLVNNDSLYQYCVICFYACLLL